MLGDEITGALIAEVSSRVEKGEAPGVDEAVHASVSAWGQLVAQVAGVLRAAAVCVSSKPWAPGRVWCYFL